MITRILIIRFSSIGDIVLTTSLLRQIKNQWNGEIEIHYLVKAKFSQVLSGNPNIDFIHSFQNSVVECYPDLLKIEFDYIFDLQANLRSSLVRRKLKTLSFRLDKNNWSKFLWIRLGLKQSIDHIVNRYREVFSAFDIQEDGRGLEYFGHLSAEINVPSEPYVAVVLGATHPGKKADAWHWIQWLKELQIPVALLGGESEQSLALEIEKEINVINFCGKLTLGQSAFVMDKSSFVIAGDTGLMHIAAALKKEIISLWGCTRPSLGMSPWLPGKHSQILLPLNRGNRPCSKLGDSCRYGWENKCIHQIGQDQIHQAIQRIYQSH